MASTQQNGPGLRYRRSAATPTIPITNRNLIYEPDHIIVLDPTLISTQIATGLKAGGWILLNSPQPPGDFTEQFPHNRIATVDATSIARDK